MKWLFFLPVTLVAFTPWTPEIPQSGMIFPEDEPVFISGFGISDQQFDRKFSSKQSSYLVTNHSYGGGLRASFFDRAELGGGIIWTQTTISQSESSQTGSAWNLFGNVLLCNYRTFGVSLESDLFLQNEEHISLFLYGVSLLFGFEYTYFSVSVGPRFEGGVLTIFSQKARMDDPFRLTIGLDIHPPIPLGLSCTCTTIGGTSMSLLLFIRF